MKNNCTGVFQKKKFKLKIDSYKFNEFKKFKLIYTYFIHQLNFIGIKVINLILTI